MAISPDGRSLVLVKMHRKPRQLYSRSLDRVEATPIPGTDGALGTILLIRWRVGRLLGQQHDQEDPVGGGPAVSIPNTAPGLGWGASWGEDRACIAARAGLFKVSSAGGMQTITPVAARQERHLLPHVLPGGKALLFHQLDDWLGHGGCSPSIAGHR